MAEAHDQEWMKERVEELRRLRDEIRVDIHLAGMELKDRWAKLEPTWFHAEKLAERVSETSRKTMGDIVDAFHSFRQELRRQLEQQQHA